MNRLAGCNAGYQTARTAFSNSRTGEPSRQNVLKHKKVPTHCGRSPIQRKHSSSRLAVPEGVPSESEARLLVDARARDTLSAGRRSWRAAGGVSGQERAIDHSRRNKHCIKPTTQSGNADASDDEGRGMARANHPPRAAAANTERPRLPASAASGGFNDNLNATRRTVRKVTD